MQNLLSCIRVEKTPSGYSRRRAVMLGLANLIDGAIQVLSGGRYCGNTTYTYLFDMPDAETGQAFSSKTNLTTVSTTDKLVVERKLQCPS